MNLKKRTASTTQADALAAFEAFEKDLEGFLIPETEPAPSEQPKKVQCIKDERVPDTILQTAKVTRRSFKRRAPKEKNQQETSSLLPDFVVPKKALRTIKQGTAKSLLRSDDAGKLWRDDKITQFAQNDYRLQVTDIPPRTTDEELTKVFTDVLKSVLLCRVIPPRRNNARATYGFVSLFDPIDYLYALENQQLFSIRGRFLRLKQSKWKNRTHYVDPKEQ
ncbi:hypothetical protein PCE1_002852 [Barthelona sp. PCE]